MMTNGCLLRLCKQFFEPNLNYNKKLKIPLILLSIVIRGSIPLRNTGRCFLNRINKKKFSVTNIKIFLKIKNLFCITVPML